MLQKVRSRKVLLTNNLAVGCSSLQVLGKTAAVECLLELGASSDTRDTVRGWTAVHYSALKVLEPEFEVHGAKRVRTHQQKPGPKPLISSLSSDAKYLAHSNFLLVEGVDRHDARAAGCEQRSRECQDARGQEDAARPRGESGPQRTMRQYGFQEVYPLAMQQRKLHVNSP